MNLTKAMLRVLLGIAAGCESLSALQARTGATKSWLTRSVERLEREGFVSKERRGVSVKIQLAPTPHALAFRDMVVANPHRRYETLLTGKNGPILLAIADRAKSANVIGGLLGIQTRAVRERLRRIANLGIIGREGRRYVLRTADLKRFFDAVKEFPPVKGRVLWRFGKELLMKTRDPSHSLGGPPGFNAYGAYGIDMGTIAHTSYQGTLRPSASLAFVHSLYEVEDPRTASLAIAFYAKNRLKMKEVLALAERFDKREEAEEAIMIYEHVKASRPFVQRYLPKTDEREIRRTLEMYGVPHVR